MENNDDESQTGTKKQSNAKNIIITIVVIIGLLIGIGVWYNNTHYNSTFQNNFMSSCESNGGNTSSCGCAYGVLQANFSYSEAKSLDSNPSSSNTYYQSYTSDVQSSCGSSQ